MVPYTKDALLIELLSALQWPVLLVGRSSLGTINHVLLSLLALEKYNVPVFGIVLSRHQESLAPDEARNPFWIARYEEVRPFIFPHVKPEQQGDTALLKSLVESRAAAFYEAISALVPETEPDDETAAADTARSDPV
jgi:dethiobiotin synthetase